MQLHVVCSIGALGLSCFNLVPSTPLGCHVTEQHNFIGEEQHLAQRDIALVVKPVSLESNALYSRLAGSQKQKKTLNVFEIIFF